MESKLNIDINEVLRYLGYKGQNIEKELIEQINNLIYECKNLIRSKYVYREFNLLKEDKNILLEGTKLILKGNDITNLLKESDRCVLMAVTIGTDIERKIKLYSKSNLTKSIILDACASTAVEEVCDKVQEIIIKDVLKGEEKFTFRYSPGYGDLPLDIQKDFISILDCERKIGLKVSNEMILFPRKSVTAIVGINSSKKNNRKCENCNNYESCNYKRGAKKCGC